MGTKRVGLARTEALIENLKRNLSLSSTTLSNVGATTFASTVHGNRRKVKNITAATSIVAADSGKLFVFNDADGAIITLPDSGAGSIVGVYYDFYINVTATSNAHKVICTDTTNEKLFGMLRNTDTDSSDAAVNFAALTGDGFDFIACNGGTTGIQGSSFRLTCVAADTWKAEGDILSTGSPATSFGST
jgi:hypothetical protein